jgi:hypothetical protein
VNLRATQPKASDVKGDNRKAVDIGAVYLAASYQMLKQDNVARELMEPVWQEMLARIKQNKRFAYTDNYYDPLVHDAMMVYLIAKHFPDKLKQLPPETFDRIASLVQDGWYNSQSSASVIMAVDAYSNVAASSAANSLKVSVIDKQGVAKTLMMGSPAILTKAELPFNSAGVKLANWGDFPLYYALSESGYERNLPLTAQSKGLEVIREFLDSTGKLINEATIGDEITVRLRVRSIDRNQVANVAVADVLPGGLEPVLNSPDESEESDVPLWRRRLGSDGTWAIQYADIREDRVLFYGHVGPYLTEVTYKVRATNAGTFVVPGVWAEAMYDRKTFARSLGGKFVVKAMAK